ncbi:MAG TPA: hypothetical protein ENO01_03170 [Candidatus Marinimicrobia bacterium]|nr:hypothetical protein [Candidatus Neomarinimicrobiota bacterium]
MKCLTIQTFKLLSIRWFLPFLIVTIPGYIHSSPDPACYPVYLVHGILGFPEVFSLMEWRFEQAGYTTYNYYYPSTEKSIREHGLDFGRWILEQTGQDTILLVTHSMGNLVAREMHNAYPQIPVYRWLMIAPPNQGAQSADLWSKIPLYRWWTDTPGQELRYSNEMASYKHLPPPKCEFAIIAGGMKNEVGFSLLLDGDDDGKVRVEETYLEGYTDHIVMPQVHTGLLFAKNTFEQALHFFRTGRFNPELVHDK